MKAISVVDFLRLFKKSTKSDGSRLGCFVAWGPQVSLRLLPRLVIRNSASKSL